jgi:hypothetical protein
MSEFECTMDGFVDLTSEFINVALIALAIVKETYAAVLPYEPGKSVQYAWDGLVGAGSWAGYATAAAYYFGLEFGYGDIMCEVFGYIAIAVGILSQFTEFSANE